MNYNWNFDWVFNNLDILAKGLGVTFEITLVSFILGYTLALCIFWLKLSNIRFLSWLAMMFIEISRDIPLLVLLVWFYFCIPLLLPFVQISAFWIAILGLSINFAGFQSEIIRSGFEAIPKNQLEVAKSFGFSKYHIFKKIILPQSFWRSLAPTLGQVINTIKLSSLASFITVQELFYTTTSLIQDTFRPLEFYTAMAVMYLIVILPISVLTQWLEKYLSTRYNG